MTIRFGANPIGWSNDDMRELGGDIPLEQCLSEARAAGFEGMEMGHKFPTEANALRKVLSAHGLDLVSGWYSAELLRRTADEEMERLRRGEVDVLPTRTEDAIAVAVCAAAELMAVPLIVCFTSSGFTARTVASYRPNVPIFAVTPEQETFRQLALVWGVVPALVEHLPTYDSMLTVARHKLLELGLAEPGERVVVTAGVPFDQPGTTNLLKIEAV